MKGISTAKKHLQICMEHRKNHLLHSALTGMGLLVIQKVLENLICLILLILKAEFQFHLGNCLILPQSLLKLSYLHKPNQNWRTREQLNQARNISYIFYNSFDKTSVVLYLIGNIRVPVLYNICCDIPIWWEYIASSYSSFEAIAVIPYFILPFDSPVSFEFFSSACED